MKRLWKTKLPAFLLAVVMVVGMVPAAFAASADITYKVDAGEKVELKASSFKTLFEKKYSNFCALRFTNTDGFDDYGRFYTDNYNGKKTYLDEADMEDAYFYYSTKDMTDEDTDFSLSGLTFDADDDAKSATLSMKFTLYGSNWSNRVTGTLELNVKRDGSGDEDIVWEIDPDEEISFDRRDFRDLFEEEYSDFSHMEFTDAEGLDDYGALYTYDRKNEEVIRLRKKNLDDYKFYYSSTDIDYLISSLTFCADKDADGKVVTLDFTLYGKTKSQTVDGTLVIKIGDVKETPKKSDISYAAQPEQETKFDPEDFNSFYQKEYSGDVIYVRFTGSDNLKTSTGKLYYCYDSRSEQSFTASDLKNYYFYYDEDDLPEDDDRCFPLEDLSFVAAKGFSGTVTLDFTAYRSSSRKVTGTLSITSEKGATTVAVSSVRYFTTSGTAVQISGNDIARAYAKQYPGSTLQSVELLNVPTAGGLYYDYYSSGRTQLTSTSGVGQAFYVNPSGAQRDLNKLTYVPSGTNYCADVIFTAKGSGNHAMLGSITISVTKSLVSEIYGATPKNTAVTMPAGSFYNVVYTATGKAMSSIQLLELPAAAVGTVKLADGTKADLSTKYTYADGTKSIGKLRFIPATNYTGSVELPYMAYDKDGTAIAAGKFCLGVVSSVKSFSDVPSNSWCYKYVTELSDAGVIDGYADGTFKEKDNITYGAALKLIMLAAGYPVQAKTGQHYASGYLTKARADGIITRSNVDLDGVITRQQVAQLAAGAMKLTSTAGAKNFTDTNDASVLALNAAGIVEGYFSNGVYTFKPNATLTRGQAAAIVWRMRNYNK